MSQRAVNTKDSWTVDDADRMYRINAWGDGYYSVNAAGNIAVQPTGSSKEQIDLKLLVGELLKRNIQLPVLIRFMDILAHRIEKLCHCFDTAREMFEYKGEFCPVYPLKVNQQRQVVEAIINAGTERNLGLEVGSKPELLAVLALAPGSDSLIICNGYKDAEFIQTALYAKRLGVQIILVLEQLNELTRIIEISKELDIIPSIGIRIKLSTRGEGRWADSGGQKSKFGLRINELMVAIEQLSACNMLQGFELIHFHVGSQISNIQIVKAAMTEIAKVFASLCRLDINIRYVDVGGGLGIDYDGSTSRNEFSTNYAIQDYANDVVYELKAICDQEQLEHPIIVTESGRALTAHCSVLVTNTVDYFAPATGPLPTSTDPLSKPHEELLEIYTGVNVDRCREDYQDTIYIYQQALTLFKAGYLSLQELSRIEEVYWKNLAKIDDIVRLHELSYPEFDGLDKQLASTYVLNFSIFQSLPDSWAIDQVFPIVPIHRLDERPDVNCRLSDITCDSDGRIGHFVGEHGLTETLPLHRPVEDSDYFIGFFLVGAYQEILGDYHNLFGDTNAVHVLLDPDGQYRIDHHIKGDQVRDVLEFLEYSPKDLAERLRVKLEKNARNGVGSLEDAAAFCALFEKGLRGYTYLGH